MAFSLESLRSLQVCSPESAWKQIFDHSLEVCRAPLDRTSGIKIVHDRDQEIGLIDLFLSGAGWDLWSSFDASVAHTADRAKDWWQKQQAGRAILILDALSLRELPWLIQGAVDHGVKVNSVSVAASELPPETTAFAKAMGFGQRSSLANDGIGKHPVFGDTRSESTEIPWGDCEALLSADPNWFFWHHWPDSRMHDFSTPGKGLSNLTQEAIAQLSSGEFWSFIKKLATGRSLLITSDHGYAATGTFPDAQEDQAKFLKAYFSSQRFGTDIAKNWHSLPPVALALDSRQGEYFYTLGRRKWRSPAGYPTLTHGGLSVLEVAVPFIEVAAIG